ncbi:MAG: hypothetical protein DYG89_03380 [Caldilinea sp. CFX5]|nr:hypothetical protein [Caldilinea sp. CFX5]
MTPLPEKLTFKPWRRAKLFEQATQQGARLGSKVTLTLRDSYENHTATGEAAFTLLAASDVAGLQAGAIKHMAPAPFARDAETTKLVHVDLWEADLPWRYTPLPNDPAQKLRPWLVLLVGTGEELQVEAGVVTKVADAVLLEHNLDHSHLWAHTQFDGNQEIARILSPRGAKKNGAGRPVGLLPQHEYQAVLVPAFNDAGQPMWRVNGATVTTNFGRKGVLPAFHAWRFWTTEAGDFETLAAALHIPPAADVGKAKLHYRRSVPADGIDLKLAMEVRGAITSLQDPVAPDPALLAQVITDVDGLNDALENTIGLPPYGRPWLPDPDSIESGWPHELTDDPRARGVAGLGVWLGVEAQETLMDAAVQQAGALREAGQRINQLALGLWAAGRLWDQRLPSEPNERLHILGPLMARLLAADGGVVLDRVTGDSSPLPPALFSSAAQRLLRDRSSITRRLAEPTGGLNRRAALDAANQPAPLPDRAPAGLPHTDQVAQALGLPPLEELLRLDEQWLADVIAQLWVLVEQFSQEYRRLRQELLQAGQLAELLLIRQEFGEKLPFELSAQLQARLPEQEMPCEGEGIIRLIGARPGLEIWEYYARLLESDSAQTEFYDALWQALRRCMARRPCEELLANLDLPIEDRERFCDDLIDQLPPPPQPDQKPINLGALAGALAAALDPRQPTAPARVRLCATLKGVDCSRLTRPEYAIGLDFPTWELLRRYDKEWLLPGVGALEKDSITALQTNPAFIDAYLVGLNSQFLSEMRWRDLAVDRTCTPLRMFWGQVNYATQQRQADIEPLAEWSKATDQPLGDLSHQTIQPSDPANATGSRLVIAFRSDLFRRYPSTLVYLVKPDPAVDTDVPPDPNQPEKTALNTLLQAPPQLDMPPSPHPVGSAAWQAAMSEWRNKRKHFGPIFAGMITPEVTFFAFDVTPSELDKYWLVLDEPPAELRFRNDEQKRPQVITSHSAAFAQSTIDQPTRVAISGAYLESRANQGGNHP